MIRQRTVHGLLVTHRRCPTCGFRIRGVTQATVTVLRTKVRTVTGPLSFDRAYRREQVPWMGDSCPECGHEAARGQQEQVTYGYDAELRTAVQSAVTVVRGAL